MLGEIWLTGKLGMNEHLSLVLGAWVNAQIDSLPEGKGGPESNNYDETFLPVTLSSISPSREIQQTNLTSLLRRESQRFFVFPLPGIHLWRQRNDFST